MHFVFALILVALALLGSATSVPEESKKNVLFIIVDDLRPQLGCYNVSVGGLKMHTPNIDRLAARGLTFRHAYNQFSVCSPSRNSFMSGRRPDSTLTYNFQDDFRHAPGGKDWVTLPGIFKINGYNATGAGKTYHPGHPKDWDLPNSWTNPKMNPAFGFDQGLGFCGKHATCVLTSDPIEGADSDGCKGSAQLGQPAICPDHGTRNKDDSSYRSDEIIANYTVQLLEEHALNPSAGPWYRPLITSTLPLNRPS